VVVAEFLRRVLEKLPYKAHIVPTGNGVEFTLQPHQLVAGGHSFERVWPAGGGAPIMRRLVR
jgi:hypothetical protein